MSLTVDHVLEPASMIQKVFAECGIIRPPDQVSGASEETSVAFNSKISHLFRNPTCGEGQRLAVSCLPTNGSYGSAGQDVPFCWSHFDANGWSSRMQTGGQINATIMLDAHKRDIYEIFHATPGIEFREAFLREDFFGLDVRPYIAPTASCQA